MCAKSDYSLVTLHTEGEGINLEDYYGNKEENIEDDRNDDKEEKDNDDDKMGRRPAPPACKTLPDKACSTSGGCSCHNLSCIDLASLVINLEAKYPHVFVPTPSLASGQATVVGYWLVPSVD
jgi:hypothetical protein